MGAKTYHVTIKLEGNLIEDPAGGSIFSSKSEIQFRVLAQALREIGRRKRVKRVLLVVKSPSLSWNQAEELHRELDALRAAGVPCWAYLERGDNLSYYLASGAEKIFMPPHSSLNLVGLRLEVYFFRDLLRRLGLAPEFYNKGKYKSAAEMFMRSDMSEANRESSRAILDDYRGRLLERVAGRLGVAPEKVGEWIDEGPYSSARAHAQGLVDGLLYEDEIEDRLKKEVPGIKELPFAKLLPREGFVKKLLTPWRPRVAYLTAEGIITEGRSKRSPGRPAMVGSDTLREMLETARKNKKIKAVVLRINSPGGSALASDLIWGAIRKTAAEKPVVATMGGVAASGGYYIASAAGKVLAMPSTLTGSIGVIGGKFSAGELMAKLGVGADRLEGGARSGANSPSRPFTEEEVEIVRGQLEDVYEAFVARVAEGRKMPAKDILASAEGRVWTGAQAADRKLVDELGGVNAALDEARAAARIGPKKKIRVVTLAARRKLRDYLPLPLAEASVAESVASLLAWLEPLLESRVWALLPIKFKIR